jgi:hypothetical protein
MQAVMRPYATVGAALFGASVIAATPVAPLPDMERIADAAVRLASAEVGALTDVAGSAASGDLANIPWNLFAAFVDIPYYEYAAPTNLADFLTGDYSNLPNYSDLGTAAGAVNALADSLNYAGNWWQLTSTNVLGTDPGDPPKVLALAEVLAGNPAVGEAIGQQFNILQEAWLPLVQGCVSVSVGGCPDPTQVLDSYFAVSLGCVQGQRSSSRPGRAWRRWN